MNQQSEPEFPRRLTNAELGALYEHRLAVLRLCQKYTKTLQDAQDLTQSVYEALQKRRVTGPIVAPERFLAEVVRNVAFDAGRKDARTPKSAAFPPGMVERLRSDDVVGRTAPLDAARLVSAARNLLDDRPNEVVTIYLELEAGRLSKAEAAAKLGVKPESLPNTLQRTRAQIERALVAVWLTAEPQRGDSDSRCPAVKQLAARVGVSSGLPGKIDDHLRNCAACQKQKTTRVKEMRWLLRGVLPMGLFGLGSQVARVKHALGIKIAAAAVPAGCVVAAVWMSLNGGSPQAAGPALDRPGSTGIEVPPEQPTAPSQPSAGAISSPPAPRASSALSAAPTRVPRAEPATRSSTATTAPASARTAAPTDRATPEWPQSNSVEHECRHQRTSRHPRPDRCGADDPDDRTTPCGEAHHCPPGQPTRPHSPNHRTMNNRAGGHQ